MCTDTEGHIWALPWIEQLGVDKTAIQTIGNMPFINTKWLNFLGLEMPHTVDEFEQVLTRLPDNAASIQSEFGIEGQHHPHVLHRQRRRPGPRRPHQRLRARATATWTRAATLLSPMTVK